MFLASVDDDPDTSETLRVPHGASGRLDQWLAVTRAELSRSRWQKLIKEGRVLLDHKPCDTRTKILVGQVVSIDSRAFSDEHEYDPAPKPENLPLEILYEDDSILAINKSPGMVVHPGNGCRSGTVVNAALFRCGRLPDLGDPTRPGIVHRIDRETSGILLIAKTDQAGVKLQEGFRERTIRKTYLAVVSGLMDNAAGMIDQPIGRHPVARTRMAEVADGRRAVTHWKVVRSSSGEWSTLEIKIETGRTHQIRVHLSARGNPILGDRLYGFKASRLQGEGSPVERVLLHAWKLGFKHPVSGVKMQFEAPLPDDMVRFLP